MSRRSNRRRTVKPPGRDYVELTVEFPTHAPPPEALENAKRSARWLVRWGAFQVALAVIVAVGSVFVFARQTEINERLLREGIEITADVGYVHRSRRLPTRVDVRFFHDGDWFDRTVSLGWFGGIPRDAETLTILFVPEAPERIRVPWTPNRTRFLLLYAIGAVAFTPGLIRRLGYKRRVMAALANAHEGVYLLMEPPKGKTVGFAAIARSSDVVQTTDVFGRRERSYRGPAWWFQGTPSGGTRVDAVVPVTGIQLIGVLFSTGED